MRFHKTDAELLAEAEALEAQYAEADAFDKEHAPQDEPMEENEMELLRKAGLNRGQP